MTAASTTPAGSPPRPTATMLQQAGFRPVHVRLLERAAAAAHGRPAQNPFAWRSCVRCRPVSAMARRDLAWHDGNRTTLAFPAARRRFGAGDRREAMNDTLIPAQMISPPPRLQQQLPRCRPRGPAFDRRPGLSRRHDDRPPGRGAVRAGPRGRAGDRAGQRRQPRQLRRGLPRAAGHCRVPLIYIEHARNYGEHNAVMTGLRHARGRLRHHHGRRPAEPARGGRATLRPCQAGRLGRGLHPLCREAARRLAQPRQPVSPTPSPTGCWTSRRVCTSPRSAACRRWWCRRSPATAAPTPTSTA